MMGNEEFLAVSAEYFFERPEKMKERHPDLHKALQYFSRIRTEILSAATLFRCPIDTLPFILDS